MREFARLLRESDNWLVDRVRSYAREHGYTSYLPALRLFWEASIRGISGALQQALPGGLAGLELETNDANAADHLTLFATQEARRHRDRGVSLVPYLGLLAYFRQGYMDLVDEGGLTPRSRGPARRFVGRFFDRLSVGAAATFAEEAPDEHDELRRATLRTLNERHRMSAVFQALPSAVLLADTAGLVTDLNEAACRWLSKDGGECRAREDFLGRHLQDLLPWVGPALERLRGGLAAGTVAAPDADDQSEIGRLATGEKLAFLDTRVYPLFGVDGEFEGMVAVLQDVTALRAASESQARIASELRGQLREASGQNRLSETLARDVNDADELLANVARELPACWNAQQTVTARVIFDDREYQSESGPDLDRCDASLEEPLSVLGRQRGFIRLCSPLDAGAFSPGEAPMLAAMTRQVERVLETRLSLSLLSRSERQFREFFDSAADAIFIHDATGRILDANKNAGIWLNTPTESLRGGDLLANLAESDRANAVGHFQNALRGEPELFQATLSRRDGFSIPVELLCQAQDYMGETALITTGRNITSRLRAQAEIERRLEMEALVAGISARLNNSTEAELPRALEESLTKLHGFLGMDRGLVYLMENGRTSFRRAYQSGATPESAGELAHIGRGKAPWFIERILAGERVFIRDVSHMPPAGAKERDMLTRIGVASLCALPMTVKDRLIGALLLASARPQDASRLTGSRVLEQICLLFSNAIERLRASTALRRSEGLARAILDALPAYICVLDRGGTLTMVNRSWAAGGSASTPAGETSDTRLGIGDDYLAACRAAPENAHAAAALEGISTVLARKTRAFRMEYPGGPGAEGRWFVLQVTPLAKGLVGAVVTHRDITERMRALEGLRKSEERYRIIVETAQEAVINIDAEALVTYANPSALAMFGYSAREFLGKNLFELTDSLDHDLLSRNLDRRRKGHSDRYELRFRHKNGHRLWTMLNASRLSGPDGGFTGSVGMITDISDRVRAEMRLRRNEARYRSLVESMHEGLIMTRKKGLITYVNDRFCAMLGRTRAELTGRNATEFADPASRQRLEQMLSGEIRAMRPEHAGSEEILWEHAAGRHIYSLVSPSPYADEEGKASGFFAVITDTTDRKGLESQLLQSQKLEAIGQLAAGIAHEINTPAQYVGNNIQFIKGALEDLLAVIAGAREFLSAAREAGAPADRADAFEALMAERDVDYLAEEVPGAITQTLEGVERISTIVRSVKQFAHPGLAVMAPADLNEAMRSTATVSRNEWKYVAELTLDLDPQLPLVVCMVGEINQVVLNLIINAAHAIADAKKKEPDREGRIALTTKLAAPWAEIRVTDNGNGVPEAVQPKIFDPFFTTKEVGRGTGQGLTISRSIVVEKHKGQLFFETTAGEGTTFVVRLPLQQTKTGGES